MSRKIMPWILSLFVMGLPQHRAHAVVIEGRVGHWKFNGDLLDSSGHGNDAVAYGDTALVSDPARGPVMEFDGNADYLQTPDSDSAYLIIADSHARQLPSQAH